MSDLEKYSVAGLDGVPRINPIFTISPPEITESPREVWIKEVWIKEDAARRPTSIGKVESYEVNIVNNKTSKQPEIQIKPQNNPLHEFSSYTYNISLHLLSIATYNNIIGKTAVNPNEAFNYVPENVLIASGGRLGLNKKVEIDYVSGASTTIDQPQRHPFWQENFFFEDFRIRTVISPTQASRGSNVIQGSMQILEPNGFTFINRLIQTVLSVNPNSNYIFNPYMIQIDFYGMHSNTEGSTAQVQNPVRLDGLKKLFPVCFTGIKTRVTNKGTLYTIDFVPYNHTAFNQMNNISPANFTVAATTVQEFFNSNINTETSNAITGQIQREITLGKLKKERSELSVNEVIDNGGRLDRAISELEKQVSSTLKVGGYCAAYNGWFQALKNEQRSLTADQIEILFDPSIGSSIVTTNPNITQAYADKVLEARKILLAQSGQGGNSIKFDGVNITVPAGTIIDKLIEFVVRNSLYFLDQISSTRKFEKEQNYLNWYKIIPRVEIGAYDQFRKRFSTKTIYYVVPYKIYGAAHPFVINGLPSGQVKKYDYLFTGKNTDVIDLSVDFNLLYNLSLPVNRGQTNINQGLGPQQVEEQETLANQVADSFGTAVKQITSETKSYFPDPTQPVPIQFISGQRLYQSISGGTNFLSQEELGASVLHSLNLDSRGDMINVKLKILGDPDFIKQDDIFYNAKFYQQTESRIGQTGSLWMDTANLTIQVNINSPVDYDDSTGVAFPNTDPYGGIFTYNAFSGIYKIITIENVFSKGKFEQVLDIVRSPIQSEKQLSETDRTLQSNREQYEKALQLAKNITSRRPARAFNAPLRSTNGSLTQLTNSLYGQQAAVNKAADALASLNSVVGGLGSVAALPGIIASVGVQVATKAVTDVVGRGLENAAKSLKDAFSGPDLSWMDSVSAGQELAAGAGAELFVDFEGAAGFADLANFGSLF